MPQIFPKWSNTAVKLVPLCFVGGLCLTVFVVWYYFSPWNTDVGYEPVQPLPFSHKLHNADLGIECKYCHSHAETTPFAGVPSNDTCMNCHEHQANKEFYSLSPLIASNQSGIALPWTRVHKIPDYAYFDHSAHVSKGVGCKSCHGQVNEMQIIRQVEPLSMAWCLECHRDPAPHLRPLAEVTNMDYVQTDAHKKMAMEKAKTLHPPVESCSGCHR